MDGRDGEEGRAQLEDGVEEWQRDFLLVASRRQRQRQRLEVWKYRRLSRRKLPCRLPDGLAEMCVSEVAATRVKEECRRWNAVGTLDPRRRYRWGGEEEMRLGEASLPISSSKFEAITPRMMLPMQRGAVVNAGMVGVGREGGKKIEQASKQAKKGNAKVDVGVAER
jgi:hypothetical protein